MAEVTNRGEKVRLRRFRPYAEYKDSGVEWPGTIPAHWEAKALKRPFRVVNGSTPKSGESDNWDGDIPWVTPEDLGKMSDRVLNKPARFLTRNGYASCGTQMVRAGSLVLSTRAPIGHLAIAGTSVCTNQGCRSLVFRHSADETYFYFHLHAAKPVLQAAGRGSTFKELASEDLESVHLSIPPLDEQRTIADFLDRETAKIDALVARKERLIELLQEKRTALITRAVTRGLDPNVPMKDSGVEWLGEIPAHWKLTPLKHILRRCDYGISESLGGSGDIRVLTMAHVQDGEIVLPDDGSIDAVNRTLVLDSGDLLFNRTNSRELVGKVGIFRGYRRGQVTFASYLVRLTARDNVEAEWLNYLLNSTGLLGMARGMALLSVNQANLNPTKYQQIVVPMPELSEQRRIAGFAKREATRIDALISKIREAIDHLKEFRTALISAAVTGKIDVRATSAEASAGHGGTR